MNEVEAIDKLLDYHVPLKVEDRAEIASIILKILSNKPVEEKPSSEGENNIVPKNCREELKKKGLPYPRNDCDFCDSHVFIYCGCPFAEY